METWDAIIQRASIREYQTKPVSKDALEKLADAGRRAPTAMGIEPWEFVVVTRKDTIRKIGEAVAPCDFVKTAAAGIAVCCKDTKYFVEDGCAATENILLAAADLGLGACWIAGESEPWGAGVTKLLKVPAAYKLVSFVALGWPARQVPQVKNRALKDVLHWEEF